MKNAFENIMVGIFAAFTYIALTSIFIGIGLADSENIMPTVFFTGGGAITLILCYVFGQAVFNK